MPPRPLPDSFLVAFSLAGEQRELVRAIAVEVEKQLGAGKVFFDEWFEHHIAGVGADLKLQAIYGKKCALAVYCVSQEYDAKPWTRTEHAAIRGRLMEATAATANDEQYCVLPLRVGDGAVEGILFNTVAPDVRNRSVAESAELVINRLRLIIPDVKVAGDVVPARPAWPETPPQLSWPMADHSGAREAFAELLTEKVGWRYLPLRGVSETGKSHITRQMLANALDISDVACGRFDFKGTADLDIEIRAFVRDLGVPMPPPSPQLHDRLDYILSALRQRAYPTLLVFDTYEDAGRTQAWVETQLLSCLMRASWLRVVIAGQKVPDSTSAVWHKVERTPLQLVPPPAADWFDYGRIHRPDLTLEEVEMACRLASHKASLLAQLLGPIF